MTALEVGAPAPDFELRDQHGQRVRLSTYQGVRPVVLVFYPSTFSPVCSSELASLHQARPELERVGVELLTVSCDPMFTLRAYSDQEDVGYRMLSDFWPHGEVSAAYDVFDRDFGCSRRSTFVIDRDGAVRWSVHNAMPDARSVEDYLGALEFLSNR